MDYIFWFDILGTIVFAISGVLLASKKEMDPIGALVLGVITAIGGGTIRDMILNAGAVFWLTDSTDLIVAIITSLISMLFIRYTHFTFSSSKWLLPVLDAIGLAAFVGIGVNKAVIANANGLVMICMGVLTGIGGGIIRDILARDIPMVFRTDIYATACIIGGAIHATSYIYLGLGLAQATLLGFIVTLVIRLLAIYWKLQLPLVEPKKTSKM